MQDASNTPPKKILVIRFGAMGDLIHVSPSFKAVKTTFPDVQLHLLTSPLYKPLAERFDSLESILTFDKKSGLKGLFKLSEALKKEEYDWVINLHPSLRTHLLTWLINPEDAIHYRKEKLKSKGIHQRSFERKHAIEDFYSVFKDALQLPDANTQSLIPTSTITPEKKSIIGIIPGVGNKRSNRAWLPEHYQQLILKLLHSYPNYSIQLFGGPEEEILAVSIIEGCLKESPQFQDKITSLCGKRSITETADTLAECQVVIGGDTGPLHLTTLGSANIVSIYAPTSLKRTGPISTAKTNNLTPPKKLECWPCEEPTCPLTEENHLACMHQITPEAVFNAAASFL